MSDADIRPVRIPIDLGIASSADPLSGGTQRVVNFLVDQSGANRSRPGLVDQGITGLGASPVIGSCVHGDSLVLVTQDRAIYRVPRGHPTVAMPMSDGTTETMLDGNDRPVFTSDSLRLVIAGGGEPQKWEGGPLAARLITTIDATHTVPRATHLAYIGNYLVGNDSSLPNQIVWSDLGDGLHGSWFALNFTTADADPDRVVAVAASQREVFAFGEKTTQVFGLVSDPLLPFAASAGNSVGCIAPYSPLRTEAGFVWLDDKKRIVMSNGRGAPDVLSDEGIATELRALRNVSDCWTFRAQMGYWDLFGAVFPTEETAYLYDLAGKRWTTARGFVEADGAFKALDFNTVTPWPALDVVAAGSATTGAVARFDATSRADLGTPVVCLRRTGHYDWGKTTRKRCCRWRAVMRRGHGELGATAQQMEVRKRDDGGGWSEWHFFSLGVEGDPQQTIFAHPGGVYRRREYEFRYSGTIDFSLLSFEEDIVDLST